MQTKKLDEAEPLIRTGYLGLLRRRSLISIVGGGPFTHAMLFGPVAGVKMVGEVREFHGGRLVTLRSQVQKYPGMIDVYRPRLSDAQLREAWRLMVEMSGCSYNYWAIWQAYILHVFGIRVCIKADYNDGCYSEAFDPSSPRFCSWAVSTCYRLGAKNDPVHNLPDKLNEPSHLGQSDLFDPMFTLVI